MYEFVPRLGHRSVSIGWPPAMSPKPPTGTFDSRTVVLTVIVQIVLVAGTALVLALLLPKSFFEAWGWLSGPAAWLLCAAGTGLILSLNLPRTLLGAALVGIPSLVFVTLGLHWLGALVAAVLFGLWCGRYAARRPADSPSA